MRLEKNERAAIVDVIQSATQGVTAELRLYGSRADLHQRGGDIDLVLVCRHQQDAERLRPLIYQWVAAIKARMTDQKLDFSVIDASRLDDPFWKMALRESIVLWASSDTMGE